MAKVKVVMDRKTNRLRVKAYRRKGWVRFPKHLRREGAIFDVQELRRTKGRADGTFWIACGEIRQLTWKKVYRRRNVA